MQSLDVTAIRSQFPALSRQLNGLPAAYFDGAAGSQVPQQVIDALVDCLTHHNANRGSVIPTSGEADALIDAAHLAIADLLGSIDPGEIVFGQNMTSLTFALSRALAKTWQPGDEIIVTRLDHDANVTPWTLAARDAGVTVKTLEFNPADCTLQVDDLPGLLSPRTRLVAVGYASNAVGTINPVQQICQQARQAGALTFIDAVHYAPHGLIDVAGIGCDFLTCSPYKFFGPHLGVLWGKRELLETLPVYKLRPSPNTLPGKWMTGTQSHESISAAAEAVNYLASLSGRPDLPRREQLALAFQNINAHERVLGNRLLEGLLELKHFRLLGLTDPYRQDQRVPTFSILHDRLTPQQVSEQLLNSGLMTWAGNHYALSLSEKFGLEPNGTLRISLLHYNTLDEVERLIQAFQQIDSDIP